MTAFAGYLVLVSVLFAAAAWTTEQALSVRRWPRRFIWILTLAASVAFPLGMTLSARPNARTVLAIRPAELSLRTDHRDVAVPVHSSPSLQATPRADAEGQQVSLAKRGINQMHPSLDQLVVGLWLASCVATLFGYAIVWFRVAALVRRAPSGEIESSDVRMVQGVGPAVFGLLRPEILWPAWLNEAPSAVRAAALAHEREHIAARDSLLLGVGLLLVALAPWNPLLWWQLQRMRFAIEADCDQRVLHGSGDPEAYARVLLRIAEQRISSPSRLTILMSAPSWLERRIRILLHPPRGPRTVAVIFVPLSFAALLAAAQIPAPSLRSPELRKLPGQDTRPGADWARAISESRYPELFDRHFDGTAVVAAVFDRSGTLKLANEHLFAPGTPPSDLDMALEDRELGVDPTEDIFYSGGEHGARTIGPWLETPNPGRLFIVYQILKWPHDASRSSTRAAAAIRAYAPELFQSALPSRRSFQVGEVQVTVLMNDDGTVNRLSQRTNPPGQGIPDDAVERFAAMGIAKERLGRRGVLTAGITTIDYAWLRRPDDAPDVADLDTAWRTIDAQHPSREDSDDNGSIAMRYFPDVQAEGYRAITEQVEGQHAFRIPWILFGRDGRIWGTGVFHSELPELRVGPLFKIIEAHYPGIQIDGWAGNVGRISQVPVQELWIAPDSAIQKKSDVDLQKRKDVLVTGAVLVKMNAPASSGLPGQSVYPLYFATAVDFDLPTRVLRAPESPPLFQVAVSKAGQQNVKIRVRAPQTGPGLSGSAGDPAQWTQTVQLEIPYGQAASTEFNEGTKLVLRAERVGP